MKTREWLFVAALIGVCVLVAFPIITYPMGRDQGMYANIAQTILNGGLPFVDMWDIKPPAIYYLYAVNMGIFGTGSSEAIRALDLVTVPFTLAALYWLGWRITGSRRTGALAMVLFTVFYFTETFASLTQSDSVVTLPMTLAVLCAVNALDRPQGSRAALMWSFFAGMLCAVTIWFKHYYALFVLALVINQIWARRALPLREAFAFSLGGLPIGALPLLYFLSNGVFDEMLIVAQGTAQYNAQAATSFSEFIQQMRGYVLFRWWHWGVLWVLVAVWFVLSVANAKRETDTSRWRVVLLWLAAGLGFVLIQAKGFDTHWIPMLPPLTLLGAASLDTLLTRFTRPFARVAPLVYGVVIVALFGILLKDTWVRALPYMTNAQSRVEYYRQFQGNDFKPDESWRVIRYLSRHTTPGDTLFVWGFRPEIYYQTGLRPATRFQAHFPLVSDWYPAAWQEEAVATLWAAMPPYVLVLQADYMPWVTGIEDDSHTLLVSYTELDNWLNANYARDTEIGDFLIWRRITP